MTAALLNVVAIGVLGVLIRRCVLAVPAAWWVAACGVGAVVAAVLVAPTQERVHAATTGLDSGADTIAAAGPAGEFAGAVLLAMAVVLTLPRARGALVGNGATPLECRVANDLNHRS